MSNITIEVTADTVAAKAQLAVLSEQLKATTADMRSMAKQAQETGMTDELKAGLDKGAEAALALQNKMAGLKTEIYGVRQPVLDLNSAFAGLNNVLGAAGLTVGIGALVQQVKSLITETEEVGLANAKFAAMIGTTETEAAGLGAALKGVGASSEDYEVMALRMEMRLKQQEDAWNAYGMATRVANGDLLSGEQLMRSAISTMEQYKAGTDQNEFALQVFGRSAKGVYDIMRVTKEAQDQYIQDMRDLGVVTEGAGAQSAQLEDVLARQRQQWLDLELAVGQRLAPVLIEFLNWLNTTGKTDLIGIEDGLKGLATVAVGVGGTLRVVGDIVVATFTAAKDIATGNFDKLSSDVKNALAQISSAAVNTGNDLKSIWNAATPTGENPFETSGTKNFVAAEKEKTRAVRDNSLEREKILADEAAQSMADAQRELEEMHRADVQNVNDYIEEANRRLSESISHLDKEYRYHFITAQQKHDAEVALTQTVEGEALKRLDAEIATLPKGTELWRQEMKKRADLVIQYDKQRQTADDALIQEEVQKWSQLSNSITSSIGNAFTSMIFHAQSWQQSMLSIAEGVVGAFLSMGEKLLENWIEQQIAQEVMTKTTQSASALGQVSDQAAIAGATAYAQYAAYPPVAAAVAAEAVGATMAFSSLIALDTGTNYVPRDMPAFLHRGEAVVPARYNNQTNGGDVHMNYAPNINAREPASLKQMLVTESSEMVAWLQRQMRNGSLRMA